MTSHPPCLTVEVPDAIDFEGAIALTQELMVVMASGQVPDAEIGRAIAALVATPNGARGFFVTYLTDDRPLADSPADYLIEALRHAPDPVADLLVKNLAMSAAMSVTHQRNQNPDMVASSQRVQQRSAQLIQRLNLPSLYSKLQDLLTSLTNEAGAYTTFLQRWGYDAEQRAVIRTAVEGVLGITHGE